MSKIVFFSWLLALLLLSNTASAETDTIRINMSQLIELARSESPELLLAEIKFSNNYWRHQSYLADLRPQIQFQGRLPVINRTIEPIILPDGSENFRSRSFMNNSANISLSQAVPLTGGTVFLSTGLSRIDLFGNSGIGNSTSWLSTPVSLGINQPLFRYNYWKWAAQIEPLRIEEAEKQFSEELEAISYRAVNLFFDVITAQLNLQAARMNAANADTLYQLSLGRYELGRIAETDLLQMELNLRNAEAQIAQSRISLEIAMDRLRDFLGLAAEVFFDFELPEDIPEILPDPIFALEQARQHRSRVLAFKRQLLESQSEVARAKGSTGLDLQISGSVGFSQTSDNFSGVYRDLIDQEQLSIGISFPIADWGKTRSRREIARAQLELTEMTVRQESINFEREILIKVQQYQQVKQQVELSKKSMEITDKRLEITTNRYLIGKIGTLDLNLALTERESARRSYIQALRSFWQTHYEIRGLTMFDFVERKSLVVSPD